MFSLFILNVSCSLNLLSLPQQLCFTNLHSFSKQSVANTELSQSHIKVNRMCSFLNEIITDLSSCQINTMQS